jgi:aminoglycoside phosphotransferase (APT) family kinase protein
MMDIPAISPPSKRSRKWVAEEFGAGATVVTVKRLTGGITSAMHLLTVVDANGQRHRAVLRRWMESEHTHGALWVRQEAHILEQLAYSDVPSPRVFRIDPTGSSCGEAALLMSHLPGRMELNPSNPDLWLEQFVAMLVRIHNLDVRAPEAESWLNRKSLLVPTWTTRPELWRDAIALMDEKPPKGEQTFIHHDYQHFNLLWQRGRISGVVDWVFGSMGSPSMDVGHCCLNLAVLYSSAHARRFLNLYERESGRTVSAWWEIHELLVYLPGWGDFLQVQAGRRKTVDFTGMHGRVEETLAGSLRRV